MSSIVQVNEEAYGMDYVWRWSLQDLFANLVYGFSHTYILSIELVFSTGLLHLQIKLLIADILAEGDMN